MGKAFEAQSSVCKGPVLVLFTELKEPLWWEAWRERVREVAGNLS